MVGDGALATYTDAIKIMAWKKNMIAIIFIKEMDLNKERLSSYRLN